MKTHLVWFRNDLRTMDNPALTKACEDPDATVLGVFIATPGQWESHHMSARQATFMYDSLVQLQTELAGLGIPLLCESCHDFQETIEVMAAICEKHQVQQLFYNRQYEINERRRDWFVRKRLIPSIECFEFDGNLFLPPLSVRTGKGEMYKVFTPFRHAFLERLLQTGCALYDKPKKRNQNVRITSIPSFAYPTRSYDFFEVGEVTALKRLQQFCAEQATEYKNTRDIPSLDGTSRLSAYLAIGVLSVRQCFHALVKEHPTFWQDQQYGSFSWFNELVWREFYQHLLVAYSYLSKNKPFLDWTSHIQWNNDPDAFNQWKAGLTGYPIVDAAMRQLNQTGWMHNRLRMITASFLVKDLLIDWHWGEQYFMSQLTDGDLAANNGGWQWAASTGTDAVPYFRIFNPTTQGQRFDPDGTFIRQWMPELAKVPNKFIHTPYLWAEKIGRHLDYPSPIILHDLARKRTLEAFEKAKNNNQ